jgi:fibronectin-binding autotransporter adhesin
LAIFLPTERAMAAPYYWNAASGAWEDAGKWSDNPTTGGTTGVAPTAADTAVFNQTSVNGAETITLAGPTSIAGLTFLNSGTTTIQSSSTTTQSFTIGTSGISIDALAGAVTIGNATNGAAITLGGTQMWTNNSTSTFNVVNALTLGANPLTIAGTGATTISGLISGTVASGTVGLTVGTGAGSGTVVTLANAANTFTGDIAINGGTLVYSGPTINTTTSPLGRGSTTTYKQVLLSNGGTFRVTTDYNVNIPSATNLGAGQVFVIGTGGGTFDVAAGRTFTVDDGTSGTSGTGLTANQLQGSGTLTKTGTGVLVLRLQSVFSGAMVISAGTLRSTGPTGTFGTNASGTTIQSGATYDVNGQGVTDTETVTVFGTGLASAPNGVVTNNSATGGSFTGTIVLGSNASFGTSAAGSLTLSGGISGPFTLTNGGTGSGSVTLSGSIAASVNGIVQNSATSALVLSGSNAFVGGVLIRAGTVTGSGNANAFGAATNVITLGDSTVNLAATLNGNFGGTFTNQIFLASGVTAPLTISSPNTSTAQTFSGGVTGSNNIRLNATGTAGLFFSGAGFNNDGHITNVGTGTSVVTISGSIGSLVDNVTQNGLSQLTLSGTNTYTGFSTATAGALVFLNTASMPGYPNPTVGNITAAAGATVGLGVGATSGQFTATDISNVLSGTLPITYAPGSYLGLDTTSAVGGTFTLATNLTNPTGGPSAGNSIGINKLGAGTLVLTGTSTFAGPTLISAGILHATDGVGLPSGSLLNINGNTGSLGATYAPTAVAFERALGAGSGQMQITGGNSGFTSLQAGQTVAFGTTASPTALSWGGTTFNPATLVLNDTGATNSLNFLNPINFNAAARTVAVNSVTAGTAATLSGALTGSAPSGLTKTGSGTLFVTNLGNSYAGGTVVSAGTLSFSGGGAATGTMPLPSGSAVSVNAGTLQILNDSAGTLAYGNVVNLGGIQTIAAGNNGGANTGSTVAFGALNAPATGAATGTTTTFNGANGYGLSFATLNLPGGSGATTMLVANSNVTILGNVSNRMSGFNASNFDNLILDGTATGSAINGVISDAANGSVAAGGTTRITKQGAGTWTLAGANVNAGNTTVTMGTLKLTGSLGNTAITIANGAVLAPTANTSAGSTAAGALGATLSMSTGGILNLADGTVGIFSLNQQASFATTTTVLTLASNTLNFDLGNTAADMLLVGNTGAAKAVATGNNTINISLATGTTSLTVGDYPLISATNAGSTLTGGTFTLGTRNVFAGGSVYNFSLANSTAQQEILTVASGAVSVGAAFWTGSESSSWATQTAGTFNTNFATNASGTQNTLILPDAQTNVTFTSNTAANLSSMLDQAFTINSLAFSGTGTSNTAGSSIAAGTGGAASTLTINAGALNGNMLGNGITVATGSGTNVISANVILGASQTWTNNSSNALVVSGTVSGATYALIKAGAGALTLSGNNTYTGGTTLSGGVLNINAQGTGATNSAIGTGRLTLSGGTLDATNGAVNLTATTNNVQTWTSNASVGFLGTNALNMGTGAVTLGTDATAGTFTLTNNSALLGTSLTIGGNITAVSGGTAGGKTLTIGGPGSTALTGNITKGAASTLTLTITSPGTVTLSGTSTFTTVNVNGGAGSIIDIGAGSLVLANAGGNALLSSTGGTINASGGGAITLSGTSGAAGDNAVASGQTLTINARLTGATDFEYYSGASSTGVFVLAANNNWTGNVVLNSANATISVAKVGNTGSTTSNLGRCHDLFWSN